MASMFRPKIATHVINEDVTIDTADNEDHTFCGIVFPVQCKTILPVDKILIKTLSVRGALGPITVWVTKDNDFDYLSPSNASRSDGSVRVVRQRGESSTVQKGQMILKEKYWNKIYEKTHPPSFRNYCDLDLSANPIILKPGEIRGIYIHSTHESDQALVYDNQEHVKTHDDNFLTVLPGRAHVSTEVFGTRPIWGWGNAWRDNREFVGKISYGVVYKLWNPSEHLSFGKQFRRLTTELLMCQRRWESPFSMLSDDCIFYILNMCRWDWMNDNFNELRSHKKRLKQMVATSSNDGAKDIRTPKEVQSGSTTEGFKCHSTNLCYQRILNNREQENRGLFYGESEEEEEYEEEDDDDDDDEEEYDDEEEEESEADDGYDDHRGSSAFQFFYFDDLGSSDEEREAEAFRERQERRRLLWMRAHFGHQIITILNHDNDMEDEDDDSE